MTLLVEFRRMVDAGAQLIVATHAPILLAFPGAEIWEIDGEGIARTSYEDCGHVRVTRRFLNDPQGMVRRLME
jgi:predicted ATPase